jgi:hypothetical protein
MAQPINGPKELNLNKPNTFDGDREGFKKFLQDVEVYMDVNHKTTTTPEKDSFYFIFHDNRVRCHLEGAVYQQGICQAYPHQPKQYDGDLHPIQQGSH